MKLKIFVEGETDKKFIQDYLAHLNMCEYVGEIINCGGKDSLLSGRLESFIRNFHDQGYRNLVIFDADNNPKARRDELEKLKTRDNLSFEYFLFPNNKDSGEIEDLFVRIISSEHRSVFDCFDNYVECLEDGYDKPAKIAKIYACLDAVVRDKEMFKNPNTRDYRNLGCFDLDSLHLSPLYQFLMSNK